MENKLTSKEIKVLVKLLEKVRLPAPYPVFIALCKSVPLIAVDLAVMPDKNHILLTYRKDEFYDGWHLPGSILRSLESVENAFRRVARSELCVKVSRPKFTTYFSYFDNREYGIALLFVAKPKSKPAAGKYFNLDKLPKNFLKVQNQEIDFLKKLYLSK